MSNLQECSLRAASLLPDPEDALEQWLDAGGVVGRLDRSGREVKRGGLITVSALAGAAARFLSSSSELRGQIFRIAREALDESPLRLDEFKRGDDTARFYSLGRIFFDLAEALSEIWTTKQTEDAAKWLSEQLKGALETESRGALPLILRSAIGLERANALPDDVRQAAGRFGQAAVHYNVAMHSLRSFGHFNPLHLLIALVLDSRFSVHPLSSNEASRSIELALTSQEPIISLSSTTIIRSGTDAIGCAGLEVLLLLIRYAPDYELPDCLVSQLAQAVDWLEDHSMGLNRGGQKLLCFQTDLYPEHETFECWYNVLAIDFLGEILRIEGEGKQVELRKAYGVAPARSPVPYKKMISGGFVWPDLLRERLLKSIRAGAPREDTGNGIVLFGPPGTGKTTIAKMIAAELGDWLFVKVSMGDFLSEGEQGIFRRAMRILSDIKAMRNVVAFFDEMELLVLNRDEGPEWKTSALTNVMLPELQALHDSECLLPVFATNHVAKFDAAARRPGRFDYVLPVGLPSLKERESLLSSLCDGDVLGELVEISDGGTISEILQWVRELSQDDDLEKKRAKQLWDDSFGKRPRVTEEQIRAFKEEVGTYTFPPSWAQLSE